MTIKELRDRNAKDMFILLAESPLPLEIYESPSGTTVLYSLRRKGGTLKDIRAAGFRREEVYDALEWADRHDGEAMRIIEGK